MDPLSDVLSLLQPRSYASGGLTAGGRWSIQYPQHEGVKSYAVVKGECLLSMESIGEPVRLTAGDCLLLPHGRPFRLGSDLTTPSIDARTLYSGARYNGILSCSPGQEFVLMGSHFIVDGNAGFLLKVLPPIIHLQKESDKASLRWSVERIMQELRDPQPGGLLVVQQVAYTVLVQALRLHLAETNGESNGWLFALGHKQIGAALSSIHNDPAHTWTLSKLAASAGMSRTSFAQMFKKTVGTSPMEYLTRWRMLLAANRMKHSNDSVSQLAQSLGYQSESAFSAAFKRTLGTSPRQYSREQPSQANAS